MDYTDVLLEEFRKDYPEFAFMLNNEMAGEYPDGYLRRKYENCQSFRREVDSVDVKYSEFMEEMGL